MKVLDASAILAFLQGQTGADLVEAALPEAVVGEGSWAEVVQKVTSRGGDWHVASALPTGDGLRVEPVTGADAEHAAALWSTGSGLSLGDRLCLALGARFQARVLTADRAWGETTCIEQLR